MIGWCVLLLILAILSMLQDINVLPTFGQSGQVTTSILMLTVIGMLVRIRVKEHSAEKEKLRARIIELEKKILKTDI
jgi:hypothetical protein